MKINSSLQLVSGFDTTKCWENIEGITKSSISAKIDVNSGKASHDNSTVDTAFYYFMCILVYMCEFKKLLFQPNECYFEQSKTW